MQRLLLVDDDAPLLQVFEQVFTFEGYAVYLASTLDVARTALRQQAVDVIISDTMMPRWDPQLPVVHQLQQAAPTTPLVLFTAHGAAAELDTAAHQLAAVWLKPIDLDQALDALHALVGEPAVQLETASPRG